MCAKGQINLFFNGPIEKNEGRNSSFCPFQMEKENTFPQFLMSTWTRITVTDMDTHTQVTLS